MRKIPDKPPPPYVPPIIHFIPNTADKVANIIEKTVTDLFNAKHGNFDPSSLTFDKSLTEGGKDLSEKELNALIEYHEFLHDMVHKKFKEINIIIDFRPGMLREKTRDDAGQNYPFFRLNLFFESFGTKIWVPV